MELKEAMFKRRSIRKFDSKKVKEEDIDLLLHYAMAGPRLAIDVHGSSLSY